MNQDNLTLQDNSDYLYSRYLEMKEHYARLRDDAKLNDADYDKDWRRRERLKEEAAAKAAELTDEQKAPLVEELDATQSAKDPAGALASLLKTEGGKITGAVETVKKVMKDTTASQEAKDKAKEDADEAQKVGLYLKKEVKRRADQAAAFLADAQAEAQAAIDRKNEVKLSTKEKLAIATAIAGLADVTENLTGIIE